MSDETGTLFACIRPKAGAWRHGRLFKVWLSVGEWFRLDVGLGSIWLFIGHLTLALTLNRQRGERGWTLGAGATIHWRGGGRA